MPRIRCLSTLALALGCAHAPRPDASRHPSRTPPEVDIALARTRPNQAQIPWESFDRPAFDRARTEHRFVLLDGAAEWCHWCHVMDETTYADPEVQRAIGARFVPIRVDIDTRPDLAARYAEYGWPATVLMSPEGVELARFRGYLPPARLLAVLAGVDRLTPLADAPHEAPAALTFDALRQVGPSVAARLDGFYDRAQGSWGDWQKLSLGQNVLFELSRARHGDAAALARVTFTLAQQRAVYDPVWGGVYQYSAGATWTEPHFEKLMTYQCATLEALSAAFAMTHTPQHLDDARAIERYLNEHLSSPEGTYHPTQDADVNAHDRRARFIDGHDYYPLGDRERRALGEPRVDPHVYARDNGLALEALAALDAVDPSSARVTRANRTADAMLATHVTARRGVLHEAAAPNAVRFLADAAALGLGLARWSERVSNDAERAARYRDAAVAIADAMRTDFAGDELGLLRANTQDPSAPGARAQADTPIDANVTAARLLLWRAGVAPSEQPAWTARAHALGILRRLTAAGPLGQFGRMLGELLRALDEAGVYPFAPVDTSRDARWSDRAAVTASLENSGAQGLLLRVELHAVGRYHLNDAYPMALALRPSHATTAARLTRREAALTATSAVFSTPVTSQGEAVVEATLNYALCTDTDCLPESQSVRVAAAAH